MTIRPCENRVGYDGETWGVEACGSHAVRDCSFCHWPVCARHLDSGETRQKCMDCYQAEGAAVRDRMASKAGKMNATLQRARITPGGRKAVTLPPARSGNTPLVLRSKIFGETKGGGVLLPGTEA